MLATGSSPAVEAQKATGRLRFEGRWLLSARADLLMLATPYALAACAALTSALLGQPEGGPANRLAVWTGQNILGNGTHVILTFLLFWVRRDTLTSAPRQSAWVAVGAGVTTAVALALFGLHWVDDRARVLLTAVIFNVFGLHHVLAQFKGFWALHHLRSRQAGAGAPALLEQKLMRALTPLTLVLILTRFFFVPESARSPTSPYLDVGQSSLLPFGALGLLLVVWLLYFAAVFHSVLREPQPSGPRVLYLLGVAGGIGLSLISPQWGNVVLPGMHGLEYYLLSARMLQPRDPAEAARFSGRFTWLAMVAAMLPLFAIGLVSALAPLLPSVGELAASWGWRLFAALGIACVLAHYWADALIYRFRLPGVRQVMLRRLGFSA